MTPTVSRCDDKATFDDSRDLPAMEDFGIADAPRVRKTSDPNGETDNNDRKKHAGTWLKKLFFRDIAANESSCPLGHLRMAGKGDEVYLIR